MTDAVTSTTTKPPSFSQTIHGKYYNKSDQASIVCYRSQADIVAEADDLRVIFKEAVGNSWSILSAILGHKYHQNHPDRNL